jgi:hypothetical protein
MKLFDEEDTKEKLQYFTKDNPQETFLSVGTL